MWKKQHALMLEETWQTVQDLKKLVTKHAVQAELVLQVKHWQLVTDEHHTKSTIYFPISSIKRHSLKHSVAVLMHCCNKLSLHKILSTQRPARFIIAEYHTTKSQYSTSHEHMWVCT